MWQAFAGITRAYFAGFTTNFIYQKEASNVRLVRGSARLISWRATCWHDRSSGAGEQTASSR
jgi:hypothetical protein